MNKKKIISQCRKLLESYSSGDLGNTTMPEDTHPTFDHNQIEERLLFFTLPMSLNYQRNSYKLWESATNTFLDKETKDVFNLRYTFESSIEIIREKLLKHKLALQPNRHIDTWTRIAETLYTNWNSLAQLFEATHYDFIELRQVVQNEQKKRFPYLSGPKIFNYWAHIIQEYGGLKLTNSNQIEIAPDTHVIQASIKLDVISPSQAERISREDLSAIWRSLLKDTKINPIDMHSPLWFWSRSNFYYKI